MYEILGDYYNAQEKEETANNYWTRALTKEIPKVSEKERILKKIKE